MLKLTRYSRENPIAARLLGLIILSSSAVTLIVILMQLYNSFHEDVEALNQRLDQVRVSSLESVTQSLWSFDQEQLAIHVNSLLEVEDVVQVRVTWQDWSNRTRTQVANRGVTEEDIEANPSQYLEREYPLVYEGLNESEVLGTLTITASLASIYDRMWERTLFIAGIQGTKTLLVSLFILWLVHTLLTRHMDTIAQYARQLHLDNLHIPLRLNRIKPDNKTDELDKVTNAINQMRETLLEDIEQRHAIELALLSEKQERLETDRQKQAAESASRAKSQFLATMSHEIRTPMNGVIGMLDMLRDTALDETQQHYLDVIHRSGESLLDIINDILDYSKIEASKMQLEEVPFDLENLVEDCLLLFGATSSKGSIELMGGVHPEVPTRLKGDPTRLRQIITNLLGNAFKFTSEGHIVLEVLLADDSDPERPVLYFSIQDTGIGIARESQDRLFESFNQADTSTTRQYGGTGLGLAICKSLAELMGGEIGVKSVKGKGSKFWFTAQLQVAETQPEREQNRRVREMLGGRRLLLVDPSEKLASFLSRHSESWGLSLTHAVDGPEALAILDQAKTEGSLPDVIALNCPMTGEGLELAQQLADDPDINPIPRLCLNPEKPPIDPEKLESLGIQSHLRKPISSRRIRDELARLLGHPIEPTEPGSTSPANEELFSHLRVLVVEDNSVNRIVIKGLLGKLNIEPDLAEDGLEALDAVRNAETPYDLILMDCEMPEMDGFEATRHIRAHERSHDQDAVPIVALTAHALEEHREAVYASGMDDYLGKPITLDKLHRTFERVGLVKSANRAMT